MFKTSETKESLLKKSGVYKITLIGTNRHYVGQAINLFKRMRSHINDANCKYGKKRRSKICLAIEKYGPEAFEYSVLAFCDIGNLHKIEAEFIASFNCTSKECFNIRAFDSGEPYIPCPSVETREKMRIITTGKKRSEETKQRMRVAALQKPRISEETRERLRQGQKNSAWRKSPEGIAWKEKRNEIQRQEMTGRKLPQHWREALQKHAASRGLKVEQFDKFGNLIGTFNSVSDAGRATGNGVGNLVSHLKGRLKTCGGCVWKYAPAAAN